MRDEFPVATRAAEPKCRSLVLEAKGRGRFESHGHSAHGVEPRGRKFWDRVRVRGGFRGGI